ncbi:MAG: hypothetical protein CMN29_35260 [Sandaracinus sp.]|nr:hypothetical protein [Sandaracinus sp.]
MQPTITINGIEVYRRNWFAALHELKPVASYHLGCPAPQLEFLLVKRTGREPTQIAARGCGRQALFRRPVARVSDRGPGTRTAMGDWEIASAITPSHAPPR